MNEVITRKIVLPLHERLRGRETMQFYHTLKRHDSWTKDQVSELQKHKFQDLVSYCFKNISFYRERFIAAGFKTHSDLTIERLSELPVLEREDIRNHLDEMLPNKNKKGLLRYSTGGSTGHPLIFYTDRVKESWHNAHKLRSRSWHGVLPGMRQVDLWGSPIELNKMSHFRSWKDRFLLNQVLLSAFNLTEETLYSYAKFIVNFQPRLIYGYPTVIYRLAQFIEEQKFSLGNWKPEVISCTSEMLYDHHRIKMREVFGCPVINEYGSRDAGLIAHECQEGNMHLISEHVIIEVDQPDNNGVGDLLVTNLDAYGMPLLRYRVGDRGSLTSSNCKCGLPYPQLESLNGRSNDFLIGKNGKLIHSLAPIYVLREMPILRQFKLIQRSDLSLCLEYVSLDQLSDNDMHNIETEMHKIFGEGQSIMFSKKEAIAPEKSGKYRWVVSEVKQ